MSPMHMAPFDHFIYSLGKLTLHKALSKNNMILSDLYNYEKIMLITGSSRGIGASIARLAIANGYEVLLHGKSSSEHLLALSREKV